jgi:asparagine synthase (glutamine-hydrolysing)
MCGIAGIINRDGAEVPPEHLARLSAVLSHRGPDDFGFLGWHAGGKACLTRDAAQTKGCSLGLVHRRLSILDLTPSGWQPMGTKDGRFYIVFNGEIYNYVELRRELEKLGCEFHSTSDTEVLLHAYAQWGSKALVRLVGMFAFAILDTDKKSLFMARDFFGIKPFYYVLTAHGFAFASEIKALLGLPGVSRRANPARLYAYLRLGTSDQGGETMFEAVKQLPAAHFLEVSLTGADVPSPVRYWQPQLDGTAKLSFSEAAMQVGAILRENIRLHLRSDVPVGVALSGGIDSSAIIGLVRQLEGPGLNLHSFSYIADDTSLSEEKWARLAAESVRAEMHTIRPNPQQLLKNLDELVYAQDEPFGSTSIYAQFLVYRLARQAGIKVMLDGQGADEIFGGYMFFHPYRVASMLRRGRLLKAGHFLRQAASQHGSKLAGVYALRALGGLLPEGVRRGCVELIGKGPYQSWIEPSWFESHGVAPRRSSFLHEEGLSLRKRLCQTLMEDSLPMLLRWQDRNSMAHSIESRVPFLTPGLVNFVYSLPDEYLLSDDCATKAVLRAAMREVVPAPILQRTEKIAFTTPLHQWMMALQPWVQKTLSSDTVRSMPFFNHARLQQEWASVVAGKSVFDWRRWRCISLCKWAERFSVEFS